MRWRSSEAALLWFYCLCCWLLVLSFGREVPTAAPDTGSRSPRDQEQHGDQSTTPATSTSNSGRHNSNSNRKDAQNPCVAATEAGHDCFASVDMDFLRHKGLLNVSRQEMDLFCRNANAGLECLNKYAQMCLPNSDDRRAAVQNALNSVNMTFFFMCRSRRVQEEYTRHAECLQLLRDDWKQCEPFARRAEILTYSGSLAFSAKDPLFVSMCCHKKAFLACIGDLAAEKCADTQQPASPGDGGSGNGGSGIPAGNNNNRGSQGGGGNRRARDFIVKFAKTLLRERKDREYCDDIPARMCVSHNDAAATAAPPPPLLLLLSLVLPGSSDYPPPPPPRTRVDVLLLPLVVTGIVRAQTGLLLGSSSMLMSV